MALHRPHFARNPVTEEGHAKWESALRAQALQIHPACCPVPVSVVVAGAWPSFLERGCPRLWAGRGETALGTDAGIDHGSRRGSNHFPEHVANVNPRFLPTVLLPSGRTTKTRVAGKAGTSQHQSPGEPRKKAARRKRAPQDGFCFASKRTTLAS